MGKKLVLLALLLLLAALSAGPPFFATAQPPAADPFNPTGVLRGQPLPGADYPAAPAANHRPDVLSDRSPTGFDLDVTYINRAPMYQFYCVAYTDGIPHLCPGTQTDKRWPDPGEVVTFTAHVMNKGTLPSPGYTVHWFIDDVEQASETAVGLATGAEATFTFHWPWGHIMDGERVVDDHRLRFSLEPDTPDDTYPANNSLEDRTNALGLLIAITPEMITAYNTPWNPAFSYSAEDWLQRQIAAMNSILAQSIYPVTPQGATERVRINTIAITASPPIHDGSHDGGWFVDADYRLVSGGYDPAADVDWSLVHELSHQVGLIDLYNLDVPATSVAVLDDDGQPANFGFRWPNDGLMGGGDITPYTNHTLYSSHSAGGISSTKGYRRGYYGEYQYDLPAQIDLLVLDNAGNPAAGVAVDLYQRTGPPDWIGVLAIDNTPDISGQTGSNGRFTLTNRPVNGGVTTQTGHVLQDNPFGVVDVVGNETRFLVKLSLGAHEEFHWLDITPLNLAYWLGNTDQYTITLNSHTPPTAAPEPPVITSAQVVGQEVTLCWPAHAGETYTLYLAGPPIYSYEEVITGLSGPCTHHNFPNTPWGGNRIYALTAVAATGAESGFSNFLWTPLLLNPTAVRLDNAGQRIILDAQNGYALLRQDRYGRYRQNFGSPHFHLEYSHFFTVAGDGRLIFSHPGDYYTNRHSVRIADSEAQPLLEFGEQGSGPGQFQTPSGVTVWGDPCTVEGPYTDDAHTLLLVHFDGSYEGAQGEVGHASPTHFGDGRYGQGALILQDHTLFYDTADNINRTGGAIEFWVRPEWNGNDMESYTFLEVGFSWFNRIRIMKDGANNLRFMIWDSSHEYDIGTNVGHWQAGEWHHVAATWSGSDSALYVDGQRQAERHDVVPPDSLASQLFVGSDSWGNQEAEATIDELRISDTPRVGNSETCARIIVADRDNNRLQAFTNLGEFVAEFGGFGSGPGQFSLPRGLAVDNQGRILVADSGNHRLQRLAFNGRAFSFLETITAGFNEPFDVATARTGQIIVADTGNNLVKVLDENGALLAVYDGPNDGFAGPFQGPQGVVVEPPGNIVVADTGWPRVATIRDALPTLRLYLPVITNGR